MWVAQAAPRGERLHSGAPLTLAVEEHALTHGVRPSLAHHNSTSHSTSGKEYKHVITTRFAALFVDYVCPQWYECAHACLPKSEGGLQGLQGGVAQKEG